MRLKLSQEKNIAILDVLDDVDAHNADVLRAGIGKLLKSGKNRIIINLVGANRIQLNVIREIINLHLIATELNGQIVLVGQGEMVKQAIQSFANPPPIKYFSTREAALAALIEAGKSRTGVGIKSAAAAKAGDPKTYLAKLEAENKSLKAKIASRKADEISKLRKENRELERRINLLQAQQRHLSKEQRHGYEDEGIQKKIKLLETSLEGFLAQEGLLTKN
ncbi:MAG: STAS domain-containing protein [Bdellovibrionota bacterium]